MKQIWIVDDDEEMTQAVGLMLQLLNCEVRSFFNARAAAQTLLAGGKPDMLLLDINMPEVTGLDLLEFLRRRPEWRKLPAVMLSSEAADVMIDRAMDLGANGYLIKPIVIEELEHIMNDVFRN